MGHFVLFAIGKARFVFGALWALGVGVQGLGF